MFVFSLLVLLMSAFNMDDGGIDFVGVVCKRGCMTTILSVRVEQSLARRAEKASRGSMSSFVREAIEDKIKAIERADGNAVVAHIKARAGSWNGLVGGVELLKRTRP